MSFKPADPEFGTTVPNVCTDCDHGWRTVSERYAEHIAQGNPQRKASVLNSVYPCQACKPRLFYRWAGKHFDPEHDPSNCDDCIQLAGGRGKRRRESTVRRPPERKDVDG